MNTTTTHRHWRTLLPGAALLALLVPFALHTAPASASAGACTDGGGVTVVVDFTDIGGEVVIGCAPADPATGREALEAAGFTPTDSQAGFICAIDAAPNPCPATFDGSFWAYWHSTKDGAWASYDVGADSSDPAPGELEGWRYNDGGVPPGITPGDAAAAQALVADEDDAELVVEPADDTVPYVALGLAVLAAVAIALLLVRARRRRRDANP